MRRFVDWIGGALWGVVAYRLWKRWRRPEPTTAAVVVEADDRAEELRAKLAESRASDEEPSPDEPGESDESIEERRRRVHEEGRAAIDRMNDS